MKIRSLITIFILFFLTVFIFVILDKVLPNLSQRSVNLLPVVYGHVGGERMMPTHFFVNKGHNKQIISDFANSRFLYREIKQPNTWVVSNMPSLNRPHALTYSPEAKKYFAVDTDNHQLISFSSFDVEVMNDIERFSQVNDVLIGRRPHDITYNPVDKKVYVVLNTGILRFSINKDSNKLESDFITKADIENNIRKKQPNINFNIGYVRSITIVSGIVYLSNSTQGNIIQINDFLNPETWSVKINNEQPKKYAEKGSFENDGLILNDIEYFQGYWYASNYYANDINNYVADSSISKNKLIRWKTWDEFENSQWEDLSDLVHPESVAYNFTKSDNRLYLSMFHAGNEEGVGSGVYEIQTNYF